MSFCSCCHWWTIRRVADRKWGSPGACGCVWEANATYCEFPCRQCVNKRQWFFSELSIVGVAVTSPCRQLSLCYSSCGSEKWTLCSVCEASAFSGERGRSHAGGRLNISDSVLALAACLWRRWWILFPHTLRICLQIKFLIRAAVKDVWIFNLFWRLRL